jgi:hypothetical protein
VFLLFATSIRLLLTSVQKLATNPSQGFDRETSVMGPFEPLQSDDTSTLTVRVGCFELTGAIKNEVARLALRQALETIHAAVLYLRKWRVAPTQLQATSQLFSDTSNHSRCSGINEILDGLDAEVSLSASALET